MDRRLGYPIALGTAYLLVAVCIYVFGWSATWRALIGDQMMSPSFADLRIIAGALSTIDSGGNPWIANPGDPWGRPIDYPAIWIVLARAMNIGTELNFLLFGASWVLGFVVFCGWLLREYPSPWMLAGMVSGSTLFAVERANTDILTFMVILASAVYVERPASPILLLAGVTMKWYPVFASVVLLLRRRYAAFVAVLTYFVAYTFVTLDAVKPGNVEMRFFDSYGIYTINMLMADMAGWHIQAGSLLLAGGLAGAVAATYKWLRGRLFVIGANEQSRALFVAGGAIYVVSFVLLSNWDYRLIFLLLCIPYALRIASPAAKLFVVGNAILAMNQILIRTIMGSWADVGIGANLLAKSAVFVSVAVMLITIAAEAARTASEGRVANRVV